MCFSFWVCFFFWLGFGLWMGVCVLFCFVLNMKLKETLKETHEDYIVIKFLLDPEGKVKPNVFRSRFQHTKHHFDCLNPIKRT